MQCFKVLITMAYDFEQGMFFSTFFSSFICFVVGFLVAEPLLMFCVVLCFCENSQVLNTQSHLTVHHTVGLMDYYQAISD